MQIEQIYSDVLRDLVPFVQFKKREKHPWMSVILPELTLSSGYFPHFLNCTNDTKSGKPSLYVFSVRRGEKSIPPTLVFEPRELEVYFLARKVR